VNSYESFLKAEYGQTASQVLQPEKTTEIVLDFKSINILREQSDAVRAALHVKNIDPPKEKPLLSDLHEVTAVYLALTTEVRNLLDQLEHVAWEYEYKLEDELLIAEINRLAEHYLRCVLLIKENDIIAVKNDFRDELEHIYKNPPQLPDAHELSILFNLPVLPPNLKEVIEHLMPEHPSSRKSAL